MRFKPIQQWLHRTYAQPWKLFLLPPLVMSISLTICISLPVAAAYAFPKMNFDNFMVNFNAMVIILTLPALFLAAVFQLVVGLPALEYLRRKNKTDIRDHMLFGMSLAVIPVIWYMSKKYNGDNLTEVLISVLPITWFMGQPDVYKVIVKTMFPLFAIHGAIQAAVNHYLSKSSQQSNL